MPVLPWFGSFWKRLSEQVLSPRVDSAEVEQQLRRAREKLPQPVIWLLGKTQSGKSSLVRALTGSSDAEIGNGFRPCTRTARLYAFPSEEECLVRFLDTRGLGEVNYDPSEDIAHCQRQSHLLIVTVRAMDHALQPVVDAMAAVRKAKRDWPTVVAQTALHEGYSPGASHPQPYPFEADEWEASVPGDFGRSLRRQREEFAGLASRFVPVDFTLPEDELPPQYYGEDALWAAIETELGLGLRALLQPGLHDLYYRKARSHILSSAVAAGGAAALPNPAVSLSLIAAIDAKMFHAIASIYDQRLTARVMGELGSAIGSGFVVRLAGRSLLAMIPVVGTPFAAAYGAATTYALGRTLCWYFAQVRDGVTPAADKIRETFAQEMAEGRRRFREFLKP
ncbi:MAG TPA: GTPase [Pirellulales bacterium]|nr:GTPase [Pirellulales bacterium]